MSAEVLARDVFPAEVSLPDDRVLTGVRVFVTSRRLLVYRVGEDRSIEVAIDEPLATEGSVSRDRSSLRRATLECVLASGETVYVNSGRGCGCSSPLRALGPPVSWRAPVPA